MIRIFFTKIKIKYKEIGFLKLTFIPLNKAYKFLKISFIEAIGLATATYKHISKIVFPPPRAVEKILYAFYDLSVSPVTYDIFSFSLLAEHERKRKGCDFTHIVIVPGPNDGFRSKTSAEYSNENKRWRLKNIIIPCSFFYPNNRITFCVDRNEAVILFEKNAKNIFPIRYTAKFPNEGYAWKHVVKAQNMLKEFPGIQVSNQAIEYIKNWISLNAHNKKIITITLRESKYGKDRNSNIKAWSTFIKRLDKMKYLPVVIRDMEAAFEPVPKEFGTVTLFNDVIWNLELRAALYQLSYLNMFVNNGPAIAGYANKKSRVLVFKMVTASYGCGSTTEYHFNKMGFPVGSQLKHASPYQRFVWEDDTFDVIEREFNSMVEKIERFKR